ncbi:MAG TPA: TetR/AcrR family transcriptional regulator [Nocardioides bacterium]|uniref:TetR/AcrR family transcriptional regulator n=1 Tax=uncultured Nocardioides sp. TaxID=198441 RepID=UPI000EC05D9C|nr:TetR/AcrR family transcriptional regulator [uncultured Nocardioides sp.]HCB03548.1 TetR/AcrR family transcriptional regulator [Nocardioides sp.]HRD63207.1 helix-turn-helix domain-containing protein [Nocardioides sp.]HRK47605.1 helix-turn-helix domain-containing protein [Nocardioides sp.]
MSSQVSSVPRRGLNARQAETVERLLEAGEEELAERGTDTLTIRGVASRAGVSAATAYTYFSSRNHLFAELFHRKVLLDHPVEITGSTARERVSAVTTHLAEVLADRPHLAAAANHALLGSDPDVERLRIVIGVELVDRFRVALGDDARPDLLDALTMALSGVLLQTGMGLIAYGDLADRLDAIMATVLRGNT